MSSKFLGKNPWAFGRFFNWFGRFFSAVFLTGRETSFSVGWGGRFFFLWWNASWNQQKLKVWSCPLAKNVWFRITVKTSRYTGCFIGILIMLCSSFPVQLGSIIPYIPSTTRFFSLLNMGVSKNNGTPKSSIIIGFSIINPPFWGTPIFGNTHMESWFFPPLASRVSLLPEKIVIPELDQWTKNTPHPSPKMIPNLTTGMSCRYLVTGWFHPFIIRL